MKREDESSDAGAHGEVSARIEMIAGTDPPMYYVNYIEVSCTPFDVCLLCTRLPSKLQAQSVEEVGNDLKVQVRPEVEIVLTEAVAEGLVRALEIQLNKLKNIGGGGLKT